jgi:protoporphyrinogen oxidase
MPGMVTSASHYLARLAIRCLLALLRERSQESFLRIVAYCPILVNVPQFPLRLRVDNASVLGYTRRTTMPANRVRFLILGAGITGLTAAWELSRRFAGDVVALEKSTAIGGLAGTFTKDRLAFDHGSHRLHDVYDPAVGALIQSLCGEDLLRRERRGRLYLGERAIPYPPSAFDIVTAFGFRDLFRFSLDLLGAKTRGWTTRNEPDNFEDFTISKVGRSLYERFYKPYAEKLYGMPPHLLSRDPAVHRVRKFSLGQAYRDAVKKLSQQKSYYYYPRRGIGQLGEELRQRFERVGGRLYCASGVQQLRLCPDGRIHAVNFRMPDGAEHTVETECVVSTIPLNALYGAIAWNQQVPPLGLQWRSLRLLYLITTDKLCGDAETHYFPESAVPFGRVSELTRYSPALNSDDSRSALTVEIPCSPGDPMWSAPDAELANLCLKALRQLKALQNSGDDRIECFSVRLPGVYPVYELGWKERFERAYSHLNGIHNLYMIGRSALFLHCNIDHCMLMAIKLAAHLANGSISKDEWRPIQQSFFEYRVRE